MEKNLKQEATELMVLTQHLLKKVEALTDDEPQMLDLMPNV